MRLSVLLLPILYGCSPADSTGGNDATAVMNPPVLVGRLEDRLIDEASDMARSGRSVDLYWTVNDDGRARLFAIDGHGKALGRVTIAGARQVDWEALASFTLGGIPYLLVGDIGDNMAWRRTVQIYVVPEPDPGDASVDIAWTIRFGYEGGPRDAESIAVDVENERILILSKRDIPAVLFQLPLRPVSTSGTNAMLVAIPQLPQPSRQDIEMAPLHKDWWWQPTAMDFSPRNDAAAILTYRGVYYYRRQPGEKWEQALQKEPEVLSRGMFELAESLAFNTAGNAIVITFEGVGAPVLAIDLEKAQQQ